MWGLEGTGEDIRLLSQAISSKVREPGSGD